MKTLIDSGASGNFIDRAFVATIQLNQTQLDEPITVRNVDGSINRGGSITAVTTARLYSPPFFQDVDLEITSLGEKYHIILGYPWLQATNPTINWKEGTLTFSNGLTLTSQARRTKTKIESSINSCYSDEYLSDEESDYRYLCALQSATTEIIPPTPEEEMREHIPEIYWQYSDVFAKTKFDTLPPHSQYDHAINLHQPFTPQKGKIYALSVQEQEELDKFLHENLTTGRIRPSKSPQAAPFFFVKKVDDINTPGVSAGLRPIQDYRYLNSCTIRDRYPLPLLSEILQKPAIRTATLFTTLDIRWGFNNIRMKEGDEWKAAFITNRGLYEPTVMFFGLCNSPSSFQRMIDIRLKSVIDGGHVFVYVDDCLIVGETLEELQYWTMKTLDLFRSSGLTCKPTKCQFEKPIVKFLGMYLQEGQVAVNPAKISAILAWPPPTNLKQLESFLGSANFWRKFIEDYSIIVKPLNLLRQRNRPFIWADKQQQAFDAIKEALTEAPVLRIPDPSQPFQLETDASGFAIAAILTQEFEGVRHPIGYHSRLLQGAETRYPTHDQELLAIIDSLRVWRHLLEGSKHPVIIFTDNLALKYFTTAQDLSNRQARWSQFLSRFDYRIRYVPGRKNKADALSRRPDLLAEKVPHDKEILIPTSKFINTIIELINPPFMSRLHHTIIPPKLSAQLLNPRLSMTNANGLIRDADGVIIVPEDASLRTDIIHHFHAIPTAGHPGIEKTLELLKRNYFWDGIRSDVIQYVKTCPECQQTKFYPSKSVGLLQPIPPSQAPWEEITADFIVELPKSSNYDTVFVVVDRFTKRAHFIPTVTTVTAEETAALFRDHVYRHHGWPKKIISDRGTQFAAKFTVALNKLLGVQTALSTAYHPETDGQTERTNMELEQYLRLYTNFMQDDWSDWLSQAEFAYNNRQHSSTGFSPFYLEYGRHPHIPGVQPIISNEHNNPAAIDFYERMQRTQEQVRVSLERTAADMKRFADRKRAKKPLEFNEGEYVWLDAENLKTGRPSRKLDVKRTGPFEIIKKISPVAYRLKLPLSWKIHHTFHISLLRPARIDHGLHPDPVDDNLRPPPDIIDTNEEYEVEQVLDHKGPVRRRRFLIKWKGYPHSENTWEPRSALKRAREPLLLYENSLKSNSRQNL